jgi:thiosulfate/3-mercaptopyruvate sulfurtransferase
MFHGMTFRKSMFGKLLQYAAAIAIVLMACSAYAPAMPPDGTVHPEMIVSAKWLSEHLNDPKVIVLHVGEKRSEYESGHIPGARFLALADFIEGDDAELPSTEKLKDTFEKLGVSDDSHAGLPWPWRPCGPAGWRYRRMEGRKSPAQ